jgi:hypothetical protein
MAIIASAATVTSIANISPWIFHSPGLVLGLITLLLLTLTVFPELEHTVLVAGPLLSCECVPSIELV